MGVSVISDNLLVKVEWVNLGEGLTWFDVYFRNSSGNWYDPGDASYCTRMPMGAQKETLERAARYIAAQLQDHTDGQEHKSICARLSLLYPSDFTEDMAEYENTGGHK